MDPKDIFIKKQIEVYFVNPKVNKMTRVERTRLLKHMFKKEYQGKYVTFDTLERELFVKTNGITKDHFAIKLGGTYKGHDTKIKLGASGEYLNLISNAEYSHSGEEEKETQNNFHRNTLCWHYFTKIILCEEVFYEVKIDIRESKQHEFMVYNVALSEISKERLYERFLEEEQNKEKELTNLVPEDTNSRDKFFSESIIAQDGNRVNKEELKSIDDILKKAEKGKSKNSEGKRAPLKYPRDRN